MKKTLMAALLGTALCGIAAGGAQAQDAAPVQKPITIKLGAFFPSDGNVKNALGNTWLNAGADYAFSKQGEAQNLMPLAYLDYTGKSKKINGTNFTGTVIGIGPGVRYYTAPPGTSTTSPYVGAGIGVYFIHASGGGNSSNNTRFGGKVNAGVEFNQTYLLEVNYTYAGKISGTNIDGFGLQAGIRF